MKDSYLKIQVADDMNRLRIADAANELLEICHLIEELPASTLQTEISLRASNLRARMIENS